MRPRDWFGVGVRMFGLWFWTQAAYWGWFVILKSPSIGLGNPAIPQREDVAYSVLYLLLGTFLFAGARFFVWMGYGDAPTASQRDDTST